MAILAFQKPDKVLVLEADAKLDKSEPRSPESGLGITVDNVLCRIPFPSLEGFVITTIHIEGAEHELPSVPGVKENVTNITLNLRQVRSKQVVEEFESRRVSITIENSSRFKASDIDKYLTGFEVLNPELTICHLDSKATMQIDITISKGRDYIPADENRECCIDVNIILIDSIYMPIYNVKYAAEGFRVEQKADYEKLVFETTTDGSIHLKEALKEAAKILIYHFMSSSDEKVVLESNDADGSEESGEEVLHMYQLLKTKFVDMDLSIRVFNCLKAANVETLGDLTQFNKTGLLKFRNFRRKSSTEFGDSLESLNLSFGTDISKYKLSKEQKTRHNKKSSHLGRTASHRSVMLSNMACSSIRCKRIATTITRAKALKEFVESLIAKPKEDAANFRRVVFNNLQNKFAVIKLFKEIFVKIADRPSGYTRIIKTRNRLGDNVGMCFIELVNYNGNMVKGKVAKEVTRARCSRKATEAVPAAEASVTEESKAEPAE